MSYYYLPQGVDWSYLDTITVAHPAMNIHLIEAGDSYGRDISVMLDKLTVVGSVHIRTSTIRAKYTKAKNMTSSLS